MITSNNLTFKNALKEVYYIIQNLPLEMQKKIPNDFKKSIVENMNENYVPNAFDEMNKAVKKFNNRKTIRDNILDAMCMAICAKLGAQNGFATIPESPVEDEYGLKMQIVYPVMKE